MADRRGRSRAAGLILAAAAAGSALGAEGPSSHSLPLSSGLRIAVDHGRELALEVRVEPGEDLETIARRVCGDPARAPALAQAAAGAAIAPGSWLEVPVSLLSSENRSLVLRTLFPDDRHDGEDWLHFARTGVLPTYDEGLWQVAVWFAGSGEAFEKLRRANGLGSPELRRGQPVRIPAEMLHPAFRLRTLSADGALEYATDEQGPFAAYRLRPGEAIYSSVVLRFTGRTAGEDVTALATQIAARSGIFDLHDIPAGYEIKVPLDLLEPEFLPAGHPRRLELERRQDELARELREQPIETPRAGLSGVLVILDPGHGGRDMGTMHNGVWEHDYVYDVACRLKQKLEQGTSARVVMTLEDLETGCAPSAADSLVANRQGTILTSPPFLAREEGEAEIGVNLRWYLANSIYRRALGEGVDPDRVLFLSLHADSRHPSLRGIMVYVPGAAYRTKTYGSTAAPYGGYAEVKEKPHVHYSKKELLRSEAVSRELADEIVGSFRGEGLPVQSYQPVRNKVIRGRSEWVPAVLRGNAVPTKVLVEMVNLGNAEDAALLGSAVERDRLADALVRALLRHHGEEVPDAAALTAAGEKSYPSSRPRER